MKLNHHHKKLPDVITKLYHGKATPNKLEKSADFSIMIRRAILLVLTILIAAPLSRQTLAAGIYNGLYPSPYFNEMTVTFPFDPDIRIRINMPAEEEFDPARPLQLILFALPNGNTIEQTEGKITDPGDDWHFDIQHIAAQTRFIRNALPAKNTVTVYLENAQLSWPAWKSENAGYEDSIRRLMDYLLSLYRPYNTEILLNGHSGGGRFIFSFLDAYPEIPDYVKRISFLDSNYGYETSYGDQITAWLKRDPANILSVMAYNDSVALYEGEPIVSPTGGTWVRSRMMLQDLSDDFSFLNTEDEEFFRHVSGNGQILFYLKKNPFREILHTLQVEKNGFIESILFGTEAHGDGYEYYSDRAYSDLIQQAAAHIPPPMIPPRSPDMRPASEILSEIMDLPFENREAVIYREIATGNVPAFMRNIKSIEADFKDLDAVNHSIKYLCLPDYLAFGSDEDFCRMPMGPETAQRLADRFGMSLPTPKLSDNIWSNATFRLTPITYYPVGNQNEKVEQFVRHNREIEEARISAGYERGELAGGLKKDVVLSNKISDPNRLGNVVIYGWHYLNGDPIQPIYNGHFGYYVDYSHGIRLISRQILLDGVETDIRSILTHEKYYRILSGETGPMTQPFYNYSGLDMPLLPESYGLLNKDSSHVTLASGNLDYDETAMLSLSSDGVNFSSAAEYSSLPAEVPINSDPAAPVYLKFYTRNEIGRSPDSHLLACNDGSVKPRILVVDGFDRGSTGNSYDFIREFAAAIAPAPFHSCSNEAVSTGLIDLRDYSAVCLLLGDESTVDETFSYTEQDLYRSYLQQGGMLFVSGSEIAWDLDYKGSSSDKNFFRNFLKAAYLYDAPGDIAGSVYEARGLSSSPFPIPAQMPYYNGSSRGINVRYPDVLTPVNGSQAIAVYKGFSATNGCAGIYYSGLFPDGSEPAKLIYLGFPFESITHPAARKELMTAVLHEFDLAVGISSASATIAEGFYIVNNFPNPFNAGTEITFYTDQYSSTDFAIMDILGRKVRSGRIPTAEPGIYSFSWNGEDSRNIPVSSGIYLLQLQSGRLQDTHRLTLIK